MLNFTFSTAQLNDFANFATAVNNLANSGPITLTYVENVAAAGSIIGIVNDGTPDNAFPVGANTVVFNDSYFICEQPGTGNFSISASNDGTSWNVLATCPGRV